MITCYDDPTSRFSCYQCEHIRVCKNFMSRGVCGDFKRADGCWNCAKGCVPNFYDYGCHWVPKVQSSTPKVNKDG